MDEDKKVDESTEEKTRIATLDDLSADELKDIVRQTRSEAKTYRVSLRELQKEKEQTDAQKRKEAEDKLKEKGEYQKLLDAKDIENQSLKVKADAHDALVASDIEESKKLLGEKWDDEYANLSITARRKTVKLLSVKEKVAGTDNGEHLSDPPKTQLTPQQKKEAKDRGLSEEDYYEILQKHKQIKTENENRMKW